MPSGKPPRSRWSVLGFFLAVAGCAAVGPDYVAPKLSEKDVPTQWTSPKNATLDTEAANAGPVPSSSWWTALSDPALDQLVTEAIETSPILEASRAKLRHSWSTLSQANASAQPSIDAQATAERTSYDDVYNHSWLLMNSSWEVDLFGAVQRGKERALARAAAQQATLADARLSLSADVTDTYLSYRACQSQVALSEEDVASREATQTLTTASVEVGFTAPYQGIRSMASVAEARTQLAATRAQCGRLENLLTRLTGVPRPTLMKILAGRPTGLERLPAPRHFSVAIPTQALMQRPDIRSAERNVAAASADIGLAEADRYPRLTLNGTLGYSATEAGNGGSLSFGIWSFGPSLSLPIFDGGRRAAVVEVAKSQYDEALANFKSITRRAIQEVEDALTRYAAAHERAENARISARQYQYYFDAVQVRYREGASNLLELEDARRAMLNAQQTLLGVQRERLQAWVALNRATGGTARHVSESPALRGSHHDQTFPVN